MPGLQVIVPLAGPDFLRPDGRLKALLPVGGAPLLRRVLQGRPWAAEVPPEAHCFVFRDLPETRAFAAAELAAWYPGAQAVFLSHGTRGAALSALAGLASLDPEGGPVIVDLADILYRSTLDPAETFAAHPDCGAVALSFESADPVYSYLRTGADGRVEEAAEKRVISANASAGTYVFASAAVYLRALAHAFENADGQMYNGLFYVCPLFNGVRAQGRAVLLSPVGDVVDIKTETAHA